MALTPHRDHRSPWPSPLRMRCGPSCGFGEGIYNAICWHMQKSEISNGDATAKDLSRQQGKSVRWKNNQNRQTRRLKSRPSLVKKQKVSIYVGPKGMGCTRTRKVQDERDAPKMERSSLRLVEVGGTESRVELTGRN
jgi:hypothetical protein